MSFDEILEQADQQIAERAASGKTKTDRRVRNVPVAVDRRSGKDRRKAPTRLDYPDNVSYNKAFDRWAESQR